MKEAVRRNPGVTLYGLPWGFAGWLGFGTTNPYHNVTVTADYTAKWVECGRDHHQLNISVLGLWNEAWQADGRPSTDPWDYALALRKRLDSSGLGHVRLIAPDGSIGDITPALGSNASYRAATWGLGAHYPGRAGANPAWREDLPGITLWSSEDYSTYSDATGAGCWAHVDEPYSRINRVWAIRNLVPSTRLHVRPVGVHRACRRAHEIELTPAQRVVERCVSGGSWCRTRGGATAPPSRGTSSAPSPAAWTTIRTASSAPSGPARATGR